MLAAIETTGDSCAVALFEENQLIVEFSADLPRAHDRLLGTFFRDMLQTAGKKPDDIEAIALSVGPGSYTGIRIGASFAIGFAVALGVPVVPVSTLDAIAWGGRSIGKIGGRTRVLSLIPDRRGGVYTALYEIQPTFNRLTAPYNLPVDQLPPLLDENVFAVGPGARMLGEAYAHCISPETEFLRAACVGEYGCYLYRKGISIPPEQVEPLYVSGVTSTKGMLSYER